MTRTIRLAPLTLLTFAALALAACGGATAATTSSDGTEPAATRAPAATTSVEEPAATAAPADAGAEGASNIVVTGATELQMKKTGICGMNQLLPGTFELAFDNTADGFEFYGDDLWILDLTIRGYEGAGAFETAPDSSGKAAVRLTDLMGRSFEAQAGDSVTIDAGERGGSLDVTLVDEDAGEEVSVSGTFSCEPA